VTRRGLVVAGVLAALLAAPVPALAAPGSDSFSDAAPLLFSVPGAVDDQGYTTEAGEPGSSPGCPAMTHSAWWRIAGTGQQIALSTLGSNFNTVLSVHDQGDQPPTAVNRVACNDDDASATGSSGLSFPSQRAMTYLVAVGGFNAAASGSIVLTASAIRPASDDVAGALALQTGVPAAVSNLGASHELAESLACGPDVYAATTWYRWTPPQVGDAAFTTSAAFETAVSVYRADSARIVGCATGAAPRAAMKVTAGDYLVQVASKGADFTGLGEGPITTTAQFTADPDLDQDGVLPPADCNNANAAIKPGALEIAGDGIDQDCVGGDLVLDRDRDGSPFYQDCNDENAKINPDAREIVGNGIDENCDGAVGRYPRIASRLHTSFARSPLRFTALTVTHVVAGSRITLSCRGAGCFKRRAIHVHSPAPSRSLLRYVRTARPKKGAVIEIRVTKAHKTGVVRRLTVRARPRLPRRQDLCLPFANDPPASC
jgi:hypothetical protein